MEQNVDEGSDQGFVDIKQEIIDEYSRPNTDDCDEEMFEVRVFVYCLLK